MTLSNQYPDRGQVGPTPAMPQLADEAFLDYIKDVRSLLMGKRGIAPKANAAIKAKGIEFDSTPESIEAIREVIRQDVPEARVWSRVHRSTQEAFWRRVAESYDLRRADYLKLLDDYDSRGPGSVSWDPNYVYPAYAKVETHLQTGGFVGDMLSGLRFDYGTRIFHGSASEDDFMHSALAGRVELPLDGKVARLMDIGCADGKLTTELKRRLPETEVWGSDISAGMVRYAHYRAIQRGVEVHFLQKAAEDLDELDAGQFDVVTHHLLFHEAPLPVVDQTIKNVFRLLRPGGTFWFSDFPTLGNDPNGLHYTGMLGALDSADNSEPFAPEFTRCNVEQRLKEAGFRLRYEDPADLKVHGRVCDKPL